MTRSATSSPDELKIRERLKNDFIFFAENCLKVRTKSDGLQPFILNEAQKLIYHQLETQLKESGKTRAIILKARQIGCSTFIEGYFIWKLIHTFGSRGFVLTHELQASQNIFDMTHRYYENLPPAVKPSISNSNAKELVFDILDSSITIGTANSKGVGRSQTLQYFHGSEVAFWNNQDEIIKSVFQTIPFANNTCAILESTANGVGDLFHRWWKAAENGENDFIPIFIPWFITSEYSRTPPDEFTKTTGEELYQSQYKINDEQLYWRRCKIQELGSEEAFQQEYPSNAAEAFQQQNTDSYIPSSVVVRARKNTVQGSGPYIIGVDPSRGGDKFCIVHRWGRKIFKVDIFKGNEVDTIGKCVSKLYPLMTSVNNITQKKPDMMFVDFGYGADIVDILHERGVKNVQAINFGSTPNNGEKYRNKRAEMYGDLKDWLSDETMPVELPDTDVVQADLCAVGFSLDSNSKVLLEKKTEIKKRLGFSPDIGDAIALTFAEPVTIKTSDKPIRRQPSSWLAM